MLLQGLASSQFICFPTTASANLKINGFQVLKAIKKAAQK
jgi:hypothetical protein